MPTRAEARTAVRIRLDDTGSPPLFSDDLIHQSLNAAIARYGSHISRMTASDIAVTSGDAVLTIPDSYGTIVRVFDDSGLEWQRLERPAAFPTSPSTACIASWRTWGNTVVLSEPAPRSGLWRIEHAAPRTTPSADGDELDIEPGDFECIVSITWALVLQQRVLDDGKRMSMRTTHPLATLANETLHAIEQQLARRNRTVRML